jgi:hypothetical protein
VSLTQVTPQKATPTLIIQVHRRYLAVKKNKVDEKSCRSMRIDLTSTVTTIHGAEISCMESVTLGNGTYLINDHELLIIWMLSEVITALKGLLQILG